MKAKSLNKLGLLLAVIFIAGGIALIVFPQEMLVSHASNMRKPFYAGWGNSTHVTKQGSVVYGLITLAFGICILAFTLYTPKRYR